MYYIRDVPAEADTAAKRLAANSISFYDAPVWHMCFKIQPCAIYPPHTSRWHSAPSRSSRRSLLILWSASSYRWRDLSAPPWSWQALSWLPCRRKRFRLQKRNKNNIHNFRQKKYPGFLQGFPICLKMLRSTVNIHQWLLLWVQTQYSVSLSFTLSLSINYFYCKSSNIFSLDHSYFLLPLEKYSVYHRR